MRTRLTACLSIVTVLYAIAITGSVSAAIMDNGDFMSSDYTFMMVTENSDPETTLHYGSFDTSGNTLLVDPIGFGVQAEDGPSNEMLASTLSMTIVPKSATGSVDTLTFFEQGDFTTVGGGTVDVDLPFSWEIAEVDGNTVSPPIEVSGNGTYSPTANGLWTAEFDVDFAGSLAAIEQERGTDYGSRITKVNFSFTNKLTADVGSDPTSIAFIKKKDILGGIAVTVPEPNGWLSGLSMAGVLMLLTRRNLQRFTRG